MVRVRILHGLFLLLMLATVTPASAQGILEQMENEVSSIVDKARSAVVSIYDARLPEPARRAELTPDQRQELVSRINTLKGKRQALDARIAQLQAKLKTGENPAEALGRAIKERQDLDAQIGSYERGVPGSPENVAATAWQQYANQFFFVPKSGSGFSIGEGYVVTTADVLEGMQNPVILTDDGQRFEAHIVGTDPELNIGLLQSLAKTNLPALPLGDSASVSAGHFAICIGNQSGEENSVALMLVGGVRKEGVNSGRHFYPGLIQIAGTVGAGVSGAPLVDARGRVIGMMAAIPISEWTYNPYAGGQPQASVMGGSGFFAPSLPDAGPGGRNKPSPDAPHRLGGQPDDLAPGAVPPANPINPPASLSPGSTPSLNPVPQESAPPIRQKHQSRAPQPMTYPGPPPPPMPIWRPPVTSAGFAIPINAIKPVLDDLRAGVRRQRAWVGFGTRDEMQTEIADNIIKITRFVLIRTVIPDSPAARSGIQTGDILLQLDRRPIQSEADVREMILRFRPGQTVPVVVKRPDGMRTLTLKVEARPEKIEQTQTAPATVLPKPTPVALNTAPRPHLHVTEPKCH
ncbi:MAG TPA: trypsin-like peptidase domain-containing protein [Chthonomonadaceae bacterium]|nr:trypsin-like peptidase domain-containing protein [Chthonomonadaceae bacterium]